MEVHFQSGGCLFLVASRARMYRDFSTTDFTGSTQDELFSGYSIRSCMGLLSCQEPINRLLVLCMHIYFLLQNCVTMYNVPFQNNSSAETYPNGPNAESFLGAPRTQRDASSASKKHQTRRTITVTAISEKLNLNNRNALMELLTLVTISV